MYKFILLLISSIFIIACSEQQPTAPIEQQPTASIEQQPTASIELKKTSAQCVELRNEWQRLALDGRSEAEQYLAEYKDGGCLKTCGRLVEDTDTVEKETWCN